MESNVSDEERYFSRLAGQALSLSLHAFLALGTWVGLMFVGYAFNPQGISQSFILLLSVLVPMATGYIVSRFWQNEMATVIAFLGVIWVLLFCIWVLDLPTGPNMCDQCAATERLARTLFSFPSPSGLLDNNGPIFATWPAAALIGYSIGSKLAMRKRPTDD
jgi:hypothetical protein